MQKFLRILIFVSLLGEYFYCPAQNAVPVIKANSRAVDIRDGLHFRKQSWYILPEKRPDYYYVEIPGKEHKVTFITDIDSISFEVKPGGKYDFVILLNGKDSCYTRLVARHKVSVSYKRNTDSSPIASIPFKTGNNSKIYFKARINSSPLLDVQFDLGNSGAPLIKKGSVGKARINFNDSITLTNSDGVNIVPFSHVNKISIGNLTWDSIPLAVSDNMTYREDVIIGNHLFQDKVIEINYDKQLIIIYDTMPIIGHSYSRHDIILDAGTVPFIRATLLYKSKKKSGWFMFDTGAYTTVLNNEDVASSNKMIAEAKRMVGLDVKPLTPSLEIDHYRFTDFNYTAQQISDNNIMGLLGNDLLKRFNVIIDNRNGIIYLQPNSLAASSYANPEFYFVRVLSGFILLSILIGIFLYRRKRRRKSVSSSRDKSNQAQV